MKPFPLCVFYMKTIASSALCNHVIPLSHCHDFAPSPALDCRQCWPAVSILQSITRLSKLAQYIQMECTELLHLRSTPQACAAWRCLSPRPANLQRCSLRCRDCRMDHCRLVCRRPYQQRLAILEQRFLPTFPSNPLQWGRLPSLCHQRYLCSGRQTWCRFCKGERCQNCSQGDWP